MKLDNKNIPAELKKLRQWVSWKSVVVAQDNKEKEKKPPIEPKTGKPASTADPNTWDTFQRALVCCQKDNLDGVGFVFTADDPYGGIDLDHCRDPQSKNIKPWAKKIIKKAKSYTEIFPSGKGVKIILKGKLPGRGRHQGNIEMYDRAHYFTITGRHQEGTPLIIRDRKKTFIKLYEESFQLEESVKADRPTQVTELTDAEIIEGAKAAVIGFSLGGGGALTHAAVMPDLVSAVVTYYPKTSHVTNMRDFVAQFRVSILVLAGEKDDFMKCCMIETARAMEAAAKEGGKPFELVVYPNALHSFAVKGKYYRAEDAADAWQRTTKMLGQYQPLR